MNLILAIDPGTTQSGYVVYRPDCKHVIMNDIVDNEDIVKLIKAVGEYDSMEHIVIEEFRSYGATVGTDCLNTVRWSGRFEQAAIDMPNVDVTFIPRLDVKMALCKTSRAKDANVRQALIDMFGPGKEKAIGLKSNPGPLYGVKSHEWAALALAVVFSVQQKEET